MENINNIVGKILIYRILFLACVCIGFSCNDKKSEQMIFEDRDYTIYNSKYSFKSSIDTLIDQFIIELKKREKRRSFNIPCYVTLYSCNGNNTEYVITSLYSDTVISYDEISWFCRRKGKIILFNESDKAIFNFKNENDSIKKILKREAIFDESGDGIYPTWYITFVGNKLKSVRKTAIPFFFPIHQQEIKFILAPHGDR